MNDQADTAAGVSPSNTTLSYAPPSRRSRALRITLTSSAILAVLILLTLAANHYLLPRYRAYQATQLRIQRFNRLLNFSDELTTSREPVVLSNSQDLVPFSTATRSYHNDGGYVGTDKIANVFLSINEWQDELNDRHILGQWPPPATVYLHSLKTPSGQTRLVAIEVKPAGESEFSFSTSVIPPDPTFSKPGSIRVPALRGFRFPDYHDFRIYAADPDPANPSHLTIRIAWYTSSKQAPTAEHVSVLDAFLKDDDTLSLTPRDGYMPKTAYELLAPNGQPLTPWSSPLRKQYGGGPVPSSP